MQGHVLGGQQPITGATLQLYAAGTQGIGSKATPLLATPVASDENGAFAISGYIHAPLLIQRYICWRGRGWLSQPIAGC